VNGVCSVLVFASGRLLDARAPGRNRILRCLCVFSDGTGIGPWQLLEYYVAMDRPALHSEFLLIPAVAGNISPNVPFLRMVHWLRIGMCCKLQDEHSLFYSKSPIDGLAQCQPPHRSAGACVRPTQRILRDWEAAAWLARAQ
jgi:hypothetical protein